MNSTLCSEMAKRDLLLLRRLALATGKAAKMACPTWTVNTQPRAMMCRYAIYGVSFNHEVVGVASQHLDWS